MIFDVVQLETKATVDRRAVDFTLTDTGGNTFRAETNLGKTLRLGPLREHNLIGHAVGSYIGTHLRLGIMSQLGTIGRMRSINATHLHRRGDLLAQMLCRDPGTEFLRVLEVAEVPSLGPGDRLDVKRLMKLRDQPETRAFRDWLLRAEDLSTDELETLLRGWRSRLANVITGRTGKVIRWLAMTALGPIQPAIAVGASAADSFLLEQLLRDPGPIAFVERHYRPLIEKARQRADSGS